MVDLGKWPFVYGSIPWADSCVAVFAVREAKQKLDFITLSGSITSVDHKRWTSSSMDHVQALTPQCSWRLPCPCPCHVVPLYDRYLHVPLRSSSLSTYRRRRGCGCLAAWVEIDDFKDGMQAKLHSTWYDHTREKRFKLFSISFFTFPTTVTNTLIPFNCMQGQGVVAGQSSTAFLMSWPLPAAPTHVKSQTGFLFQECY